MTLRAASVVALLLPSLALAAATEVQLASDGHALMPVVVATQAGAATRQAAVELARQLTRITGAPFSVTNGDGTSGLAVGCADDFPAAPLQLEVTPADPTQREDYLLHSHAHGVLLLGATGLAVEHAVWDLLHQIGYRQFFPGPHWEVVPTLRGLRVALDKREHPAYLTRRIWYGFGPWDYAQQPYADWCARNRATSGLELNTGHAYDGIIAHHKAEFAAHPEYLGLVDGVRKSSKFCIANPGLRRLVVEDALRKLAQQPSPDSVSVDPSDGGGWCECAACARMGSVSDRAVTLANEVAAAVDAKYPGKLVGMYAYNYHSPPPHIRVHPQLVVSVATAFLKGGNTLDELIAGWSAQGARLGIREYYSVNTWDRDLPGAARGGNLDYLLRTIPAFHAQGARFMSAESSDNWGPNGLGYYLAARLLWDVREASQADALVEDFLTRAFGPARKPMREFYRQLDGAQPHLMARDQLGRMFRALAVARTLAGDAAIRARLDDLMLYARYVDLYQLCAQASGATRQQAFEALIRHAYRMRETMLIHAKALYRDLAERDKTVRIPAAARWDVPEGKNPWKSSAPFTAEELERFLTEGLARNQVTELSFKPVAFGADLVSAAPLNLPEVPAGNLGAGRGTQRFFTRLAHAPATLELLITGGLIEHYRDRGNVRVELRKLGGPSQTGERETLIAEDRSAPPDGQAHKVMLAVKEPGLYTVTVSDGGDRTLVQWPSALPLAIKSDPTEPMNASYTDYWLLYFYVPKGTQVVGLFGGEHGEVRDSAGRPLFWLNGRPPNYYSIAVPDGEDGKAWSIRFGRGAIRLLTVPPYFARTANELLLPAEVVARDAAKE
jgi:hypothetical protein